MKDEYMWNTGNTLNDMRLIIEGAVVLFEEDASPLVKLSRDHQEHVAYNAFDTIGEALYTLRNQIRDLHEAHAKEVYRQLEAADET